VRPRIGDKSIYELQRSDIKTMLAEIAKEHGPVMADRVLAYVRKAFNWQMIDDDNFKSPHRARYGANEAQAEGEKADANRRGNAGCLGCAGNRRCPRVLSALFKVTAVEHNSAKR